MASTFGKIAQSNYHKTKKISRYTNSALQLQRYIYKRGVLVCAKKAQVTKRKVFVSIQQQRKISSSPRLGLCGESEGCIKGVLLQSDLDLADYVPSGFCPSPGVNRPPRFVTAHSPESASQSRLRKQY